MRQRIAFSASTLCMFVLLQQVPHPVQARATSNLGHQRIESYGFPVAATQAAFLLDYNAPGLPATERLVKSDYSKVAMIANLLASVAICWAFLLIIRHTQGLRRFSMIDLLSLPVVFVATAFLLKPLHWLFEQGSNALFDNALVASSPLDSGLTCLCAFLVSTCVSIQLVLHVGGRKHSDNNGMHAEAANHVKRFG